MIKHKQYELPTTQSKIESSLTESIKNQALRPVDVYKIMGIVNSIANTMGLVKIESQTITRGKGY